MESSSVGPTGAKAAHISLQILLPIVLVLTSIRLLLFTAKFWIQIEYRMPKFPEDRYGFSLEDRYYWSSVDIDYLLGKSGPEYFDDFQLDDGSPMHNQRELKHLGDVVRLTQAAWKIWGVAIMAVVILLITLFRLNASRTALLALMSGSKLTLILMGMTIVGIVIAFGLLFVGFHRIFFEGESWLFAYSDTFIRLYPERFWRDAFILFAVITVAEAGLVYQVARTFFIRLGGGEV